MSHFYTADPHFNHAAILRLCGRPVKTTRKMDNAILGTQQALVRPDDDLWVLGDFAFAAADHQDYIRHLFDRIPARKPLMRGNHDSDWVGGLGWVSVDDICEVNDGGQRLVLCHHPMLTWPNARKGALQLFGHVHAGWKGRRNSMNAGVDVWNFEPVTTRQIAIRAATLPINPVWGVVERGIPLD